MVHSKKESVNFNESHDESQKDSSQILIISNG